MVQIEVDPVRAGVRLPTEVPLVGDAKAGPGGAAAAAAAAAPTGGPWSRYQRGDGREWRDEMAPWSADRDPIAPQYLIGLHRRAGRRRRDPHLRLRHRSPPGRPGTGRSAASGEFYLSGNLATMAPGLPYAIAMQHAYPGRQVIAFVGDGGFAMLMAEFHTAARHGLPIKVVVNNNNSLGQILWEQMVLGYPEYGVRFGEPEPDYAAWARGCGGYGARVDRARPPGRRVAAGAGPSAGRRWSTWRSTRTSRPMPGKVTYEQAKNFAEAFLRGQPHKAAIATTLFADRIEEMRHA